MKKIFVQPLIVLLAGAILLCIPVKAQTDSTASAKDSTASTEEPVEKKGPDNRPQRDAFESSFIVNEHTTTLPKSNTLEFMIQHRFGKLTGASEFDLFGLYAPSNIRLGMGYTPTNWLMVGIGTTKFHSTQDLNWKAGLLKQTRSNSMPVNVTYNGNVTYDARKLEFPNRVARLSYFNELLVSRRFNGHISLQAGFSYSHFNILDKDAYPGLNHSNMGWMAGGRYKFSPQSSVLFEYCSPIGTPEDIKPNAALGMEVATSGHAFQLLLSTYDAIIPQADYTFNRNDFTKKGILIGFNITRLWGF